MNGADATMDTLQINIESAAKDSSKQVDDLITKLKNLNTALMDVVKSSSNISKLKQNVSGIKNKTATKTPQIKGFAATDKNIKNEISSKLDTVGIKSLNGYKIAAENVSSAFDGMTTSITTYKNKVGNTVTVTQKLKDGIAQVGVTTNNTNKRTSQFQTKLTELTKKISLYKLAITGVITSLIVTGKKIGSLVDNASNYNESFNMFMVTMGDYGKKGLSWIEKFSNALYLDPSNVMQYMGSFNSLIKGLGTGSDKAYLMSKNLTQLTYDLASFKNLSFEESYQKLSSAISGELEPLRNVGVALSQNTLQQTAYSLGIKTSINDMTEAQKAQLRYIQIMKSSSEWQTDMGRTLIQPANALRVVKEQFSLLGQAIGRVFLPIVMKTIPYVMVITEELSKLANRLATLLGFKIDFSTTKSNLSNISTGITNIGDSAEDTKNKLNTMLAPFDELNVVQSQTQSAGKGLGTGADDLGVDLPEYDALAGLTRQFSDNIDNARKNLKKIIPVVVALGAAFGLLKVGKSIFSFFSLLGGGSAKAGLQATTSLVGTLAGKLGMSAGGLGGIVLATAAAMGVGAYTGVKFNKMLSDAASGNKSLTESFNELNGVQKGLFIYTASNPLSGITAGTIALSGVIKELNTKINRTVDDFDKGVSKSSQKKLTPIIDDIKSLDKAIDTVSFKGKFVTDADVADVNTKISNIKNTIVTQLDTSKNKELSNLKTLEKTLGTDKYQALLDKTSKFYDDQSSKVQEGYDRINEIIATAHSENRELTEKEMSEINTIRRTNNDIAISDATSYADEYERVMARLKHNVGALTLETASETIKNAKKTKDSTIKDAEEQYTQILAQADKLAEAGAINDDEYQAMVNAAKKTYNETVDTANKQYDDIKKTTKTKLGENAKYIDDNSGEVLTTWQYQKKRAGDIFSTIGQKISNTFSDMGKNMKKAAGKVGETLDDLKNKFNNWKAKLKTPHIKWDSDGWQATGTLQKVLSTLHLPTTLPKLNVDWYEAGGYPTTGELFFARENGPEYVGSIGNKTAVANNDQITTSITNALIQALDQYDFGNNQPTKNVIYIGNKKVFEGYGEYVDSENDRYGVLKV